MAAKIEIETGTGNVYADLGNPDAPAMLAKAQLTARLAQIIEERNLSQREAAEIVGMPQPKLSTVLRGQFRGVSEAKLMDCLRLLGHDVKVTITPTKRKQTQGRYTVAFA
jgi:predicted XRE-type DNA-binding protein